ncbi:hypothetical protein ACFC07_22070 [Streptomyces sp. NPDC056099]|uniref:hypothetical protein n=1 Tax=unclassified Streptomyces TaxID=2593676 RepID=UPI0035DE98A8
MSSTLDSIATGSAVGALLPLVTAVVQQPRWSAHVKKAVAVASALIAGVVTVVSVGGLDQFTHGVPTLATFVGLLAASQSAYDLIWKPTGVAPVIESATSRKTPTAAG